MFDVFDVLCAFDGSYGHWTLGRCVEVGLTFLFLGLREMREACERNRGLQRPGAYPILRFGGDIHSSDPCWSWGDGLSGLVAGT